MGKKKYIDKKSSQKFHLLHRSHTDTAYAAEGVPSELVLVSDNELANREFGENIASSSTLDFKSKKDHINELGFLNDGYDYSQHLKEMGGGKFISKDGKVGYIEKYKAIDLPDEALPSETELERHYEAITISHEFMDEDLRAALFDGCDSEGEFEELNDDFVMEVSKEPEVPDFDFDAHIAKLLARSENKLNARRTDNLFRPDALKTIGEDEDDEEEEGSEMSFDMESCMIDDTKRTKQPVKRVNDAQLEKLLAEEYNEEDYEEFQEDEEDSVNAMDYDAEELNEAMDQFLQEQKDRVLVEGTSLLVKGLRSSIIPDPNLREVDRIRELTAEEIKQSYAEQVESQNAWQEDVAEIEANVIGGEMLTCQEYLRAEKVQEQWDCETIISTYSTMENHPTVVKDKKSKFKPHKSTFQQNQETAYQNQYQSLGHKLPTPAVTKIEKANSKIVLTGRLLLPEGYSSYSQPSTKPRKEKVNIQPVIEEESESSDESNSDEEGEEEGEEERPRKDKPDRRPRKETAEEKKARKEAVKNERRANRAAKKALKQSFTNEGKTFVKKTANQQSINNVSVFKYST